MFANLEESDKLLGGKDPTMTMSVSLRPLVHQREDDLPLRTLVDRIYQERGHMRNVTHDSLRAEIEAEEHDVVNEQEDDRLITDEDDAEDSEARLKALLAAREGMVTLVGEANNEVLMLQDLVSLLVSKDVPQAANSMSPAIQELTQPGTFAFDTNPRVSVDQANVQQARVQADGLSFRALNESADRLLSSANQLESEITKETKYWDQVLSLTERGWNITRLRGSAHTLGVRYACAEAATQYQAAGQASLRPTSDGSLTIDSTTSDAIRCIRVRIAHGGAVIGASRIPPLLEAGESDLDALVNQARDSLFDEELFQLLMIEARDLLAYGVKIKSDCISIPLDGQTNIDGQRNMQPRREILIDLQDREPSLDPQEKLADSLVLHLRLGLSHIYRDRRRRRTRPPAPLSATKQSTNAVSLLKSILCLIAHRHAAAALIEPLDHLRMTLCSAGVDCSFEQRRNLGITSKENGKTPVSQVRPELSSVAKLFSSSLGSQSTTCAIRISTMSIAEASTTTNLSAPLYGTSYTIYAKLTDPLLSENAEAALTSVAAVRPCIERMARRQLLKIIAETSSKWTLNGDETHLIDREDADRTLRLQLVDGKMALLLMDATSGDSARVLGTWDGTRVKTAAGITSNALMDIAKEL